MNKILLPSGYKAVNFGNDIKYNIAGLGRCTKLILQLLDIVEAKFDCTLPIKYIYGSPSILWNGGRITLKKYKEDYILHRYALEIDLLKSRGIIPLFTFSNVYISDVELEDKTCNEFLKLIAKTNSEIIVTNEKLKEYIKFKYPNISLHASVIKTAFEDNRSTSYYKNLSNEFSNYVVHPEDNFNISLLQQIPKLNAEIMLNERCKYTCKIRDKHYLSISEEQKNRMYKNNVYNHFLDACEYIPEYKQANSPFRNTSLTLSEVEVIYNLGYRQFKLQGRTDGLYVYFFDLMRYMLEPNIVFPHLYPIFSFYIDKFIKEYYSE